MYAGIAEYQTLLGVRAWQMMDGGSIVSLNEVAIEAEKGNGKRELSAFVFGRRKGFTT